VGDGVVICMWSYTGDEEMTILYVLIGCVIGLVAMQIFSVPRMKKCRTAEELSRTCARDPFMWTLAILGNLVWIPLVWVIIELWVKK